MSFVERAAKKLLPILQELKKRMIREKQDLEKKDIGGLSDEDEDSLVVDLSKVKGGSQKSKKQ